MPGGRDRRLPSRGADGRRQRHVRLADEFLHAVGHGAAERLQVVRVLQPRTFRGGRNKAELCQARGRALRVIGRVHDAECLSSDATVVVPRSLAPVS